MALIRQIANHEEKKHLQEFYISTLSPPFIRQYLVKCDGAVHRNATGISLQPPETLTDHKIWLNLTICGIVLVVAITLFTLLKKKMFNQGVEKPLSATYKPLNPIQNPWKHIIYGNKPSSHTPHEESTKGHWYNWMRNTLSESDYELLTRGGPAALAYVRFQRSLFWCAVLICAISLIILLPVNLGGDLFLDILGRTSLVNLAPSSNSLWIHVLFSLALLPIGLMAMCDYGAESPRNPKRRSYANTLMFSGLPADRANKQILRDHFREAYPDFDVMNVELTYDVGYLTYLDRKLKDTNEAFEYCMKPENTHRVTVNAGGWSCCGCCHCCTEKIDGLDYYTTRRMQLAQELHSELDRWKKVNPVFFVTFANEHQAHHVKRDYERDCCNCHQPPQTRHSRELETGRWNAYNAPHPANVYWENLSSSGCGWYGRAIAIGLILTGLIIALAFAVVLLSSMALPAIDNAVEKVPAGLCEIFPALVLWLINQIAPSMISSGVKIIGYWSRPNETVAEMRYIFSALLLAVLLMPSLGLLISSSHYYTKPSTTMLPRPECTYLPDNGAIFIHYLIFFAFLTTAVSLFRPRLVLSYIWRAWSSKSDAESFLAGKVDTSFEYGEEYPQYITVFAITVVYSFLSPLITIFGVVALFLKYMLDQYMLCNTYKRSTAPTSAHTVAVAEFFASMLLQLLLLFVVFVLRNGLDACAVVLAVAFFLYTIFCICLAVFGEWNHHSFLEFDDADGNGDSGDTAVEVTPESAFVQPILRHHQHYRALLQGHPRTIEEQDIR